MKLLDNPLATKKANDNRSFSLKTNPPSKSLAPAFRTNPRDSDLQEWRERLAEIRQQYFSNGKTEKTN